MKVRVVDLVVAALDFLRLLIEAAKQVPGYLVGEVVSTLERIGGAGGKDGQAEDG